MGGTSALKWNHNFIDLIISAHNTKGDNFSDFLFTCLSVKPSKIGSTQNETDRSASYERVNIHLKINALGLELLNTWQSDQALYFLLVG